jgi:hypothetical protein
MGMAVYVSFHPTNSSLVAVGWMGSNCVTIYDLVSNNFDLIVS